MRRHQSDPSWVLSDCMMPIGHFCVLPQATQHTDSTGPAYLYTRQVCRDNKGSCIFCRCVQGCAVAERFYEEEPTAGSRGL